MSTEAPTTTRQVVETLLLDSGERNALLRIARSRYHIAKDRAEDLLQDLAVDLLRQRQYVRRPRAYLHAVFRVRCSRQWRPPELSGEIPEELAAMESGILVAELDRRVSLRQALQLISAPCRKLLRARYIEGQSLRASAERMTLAYSGITKTINRCLKKLRACLA